MSKEIVEVLVSGGKATAAPPIGPALGPLKVNIGEVVAEINKKTQSFAGMQVPVKIEVDTETKEFNISIGTPPTAELIKKELGIKAASGEPNQKKVGNLTVDQVLKLVSMKEDSLMGATLKKKVNEIAGSCDSMGVDIEGMDAHDFILAVNEGKFDSKLK
jgi:large subunit ribosomal protein L11